MFCCDKELGLPDNATPEERVAAILRKTEQTPQPLSAVQKAALHRSAGKPTDSD